MRVLGIDPGQMSAGFAVREGSDLIAHAVLENPSKRRFPATIAWVTRVADETEKLVAEHAVDLIAVELVRVPNVWHGGRRQVLNPESLIATAQVLGAIQALTCCPIVEVPPGNMGKGPLGGYPDALVSTGERRRDNWRACVGTGRLRHARAAWDQAGHGAIIRLAERQQ